MGNITAQQKLRHRLDTLLYSHEDRYFDCGVQFSLYDRDPSTQEARFVKKLWPVYGGVFDQFTRRYIGPPTVIHEFKLSEAFVDFVFNDRPEIFLDVALGAPGSGKTMAIIARMIRKAFQRPCTNYIATGATGERRLILWDGLLESLAPWGAVFDKKIAAKQIILKNGVVFYVVAATPPSKQAGMPFQGLSGSEAFGDEWQSISREAKQELAARGRRNKYFKISATATNQLDIPEWVEELEDIKNDDDKRLTRVSGKQNPFLPPDWYERLRKQYSDRDARLILDCEDLPPEFQVYHQYSSSANLQVRPPDAADITQELTNSLPGGPYQYIAATDFGVLINATEILKCFRDKDGNRQWWAIDEIVTERSMFQTHAREIVSRYNRELVIAIGDPHHNIAKKDIDRSPYVIFRKVGLRTIPAVSKGYIAIEHRVAMMNSLLHDGEGKRSLFIEKKQQPDGSWKPAAPKLHRAFLTEKRTADGKVEGRKNLTDDWSDYPSAVGYGLYRWERIRANMSTQIKSTGIF